MSVRDLGLILFYVALFGAVVLGLGYQSALKHGFPSERAPSDEAAASDLSISTHPATTVAAPRSQPVN